MADNVIRRDIIEILFDADMKELTNITKEINTLKKSLSGDFGDEAFDDMKSGAKDSSDAFKNANREARTFNQTLKDLGNKGAKAAYNGLKKVASISFKALAVGLGAAATATGALVKNAVAAYADYEQLVGGVDTLFKGASSVVQKNANNAYKTAGLSANAYMETVTSFSASLIQSVNGDTQKAAKLADMALSDMSDNANKMGTDMGSIQFAYQGFAKQNYTMLDNLKLGYGGTKTEMQRLVKDAAKIDKSIDANSLSYANVVKAIHAVQDQMGVTGTTAKEAEKTITGSFNSMKSAWGNLMPALIKGGDEFDQCVDNLVSTTKIFITNLKPAVTKALSGVGKLIEELAPMIEEEFPKLVDELLPPLIKAGTALLKGFIKALPSVIKTVAKELPNIIKELGGAIADAFSDIPVLGAFGKFFKENGEQIAKFIPILLGLVGAFAAFSKIKSIGSMFGGLFGKKGANGEGGSKGGLFSGLEDLAKIKTKDVLKGMANLAIIVAGFGVLAAAFLAVSPYIAELGDFGSFVKMMAVMAIMGLVGGVLAKCGAELGEIKIKTVLMGMANMGIALGSFAIAYMILGAISLIPFNIRRVMGVVLAIGAMGIVSAALAGLAGALGMIPILVLLLGMANMGIALYSFAIAYMALGAISLIPFDINRIMKVVGVIGAMGLVGGALALFAGIVGVIPIPVVLAGLANMALVLGGLTALIIAFGKLSEVKGINKFIETGGELLVKVFNIVGEMAGSLIGGLGEGISNSLPKIGENLGQFGTNVKPLFDLFDGVDMGGVGAFFGALAALFGSSVANDVWTNIKGIFGDDENSFATFGTTLSEFGTGAKGFFDAVAKYPENGFKNATQLFESLSSIDKLKKVTKKVNFSEIASGLGTLSKDSIKQFFAMAGELKSQDFENAKLMFETLGRLDDLPKKVEQSISDIVKKISNLPKKMGDALKNNSSYLSNGMVEMWKAAVQESVKPVNKLLEGANHILKEFGSKKKVIEWTPYARGTGGHRGGNALVNDGNGAELIQMPNGRMFIANGRNVLLPNAPKGMKVLPAEQTARLMGRNSPTFKYANGTGDLDVWSFYDNAKGLVDKITENISYEGLSALAANMGQGMVSTFSGAMPAWIEKLFEEGGQSIGSYVSSKGVVQWLPTVVRALKMEGQYSLANVARTLFQMKTESGGNPMAINNWDRNAKKGTPSKGLMQVIDPTFNAYARSGFNKNIYDPLSNILASIRYAVSRYGSLSKAYRGVGYADGVGTISLPQASPINLAYTPESSYTGGKASVTEHNTYAPVMNFYISNGSGDERSLMRKIKKAAQEAIADAIDGAERNNPRLKEV